MNKRVFLIALVLIIVCCIGLNFMYAIKYHSSCGEENIYKYKLAVYKIDTGITHKIEYTKIGGLAAFLNLQQLKCSHELELEKYTAIKNRIDSANNALQWRLMTCGLWINKNGEIGLKTYMVVGMEGEVSTNTYITRFGYNEDPPLKTVIDTTTFHELGNTFYKDKNHIYHRYDMIDGGSFNIFDEADYASFQVLGDCYAKDKNNIYEDRAGKLDSIDYKTFKTKKGIGCFAKDKYGYISWDRRLDTTGLYTEDEYIRKAIQELDK